MKKQSIILLLAIVTWNPIISEAMEIRQELYVFRMAMLQEVTIDTFVISEQFQVEKNSVISCRLSLVYFERNSADLSQASIKTILSDLEKCEVMQKQPLQVTGYTCQLGSGKLNQFLSLQRARVVTDFLQARGFIVVTVQGKGAQHPITVDPWDFKENRRVEITIQP